LKNGLSQTAVVTVPAFNNQEVQKVVSQKADQGTLDKGSLFTFEILFAPNQTAFNPDTYAPEFKKVIELAGVYGGAVITVEGHSDPLNYIKKKAAGTEEVALGMIKQSAKNLSMNRANVVRDSLIGFAKQAGVALDPSQFATVGYGITRPKTGVVNGEPRAPTNDAEWRSNLRAVFRLISVEAEESVFTPVTGGVK
jgi:outer membrane protein OmpA-like peptidoglycan-associated protein